MIYGRLSDFESMGLAVLGETVTRAVQWIRQLPADPREGRHRLWDDEIYALVLRYPTGAAESSRFETHRRYVDLQYTLAGGEAIEWAPRTTLTDDGDYDPASDLLFHFPGATVSRVVKPAGMFSIYTPVDAHRGKIRIAGHDDVLKLVVKIPIGRFAPS
ncbi:MAG: YhcH/YjgK/YiaL family protein [Opitutaceae bacterium]|nr:YhcH/YjgK/YiaL family protein [Opitutaceae bacterium]